MIIMGSAILNTDTDINTNTNADTDTVVYTKIPDELAPKGVFATWIAFGKFSKVSVPAYKISIEQTFTNVVLCIARVCLVQKFSKVCSMVILYSRYSRTQTFQNSCLARVFLIQKLGIESKGGGGVGVLAVLVNILNSQCHSTFAISRHYREYFWECAPVGVVVAPCHV